MGMIRDDEKAKVEAHADRGNEAAVGGRASGAQVQGRQGEGEAQEARFEKAIV